MLSIVARQCESAFLLANRALRASVRPRTRCCWVTRANLECALEYSLEPSQAISLALQRDDEQLLNAALALGCRPSAPDILTYAAVLAQRGPCRRCQGWRVRRTELQPRAADEATLLYEVCLDCKRRFLA